MTTVRDNVLNSKLTATYDALDRLVSATTTPYTSTWAETAPLGETYAYNAIGNLTGRYGVSATGAITYPVAGNARPHAATATASGDGYTYDANGNMTMRREVSGTQTFTYTQAWTVDNRLAGVTKTDLTSAVLAVTTCAYDGDGVRVRKVLPRACRGADPAGTTLYIGPTEISLKYLTPEWTAASGTAADGFDLRKTTMTNGWDAGASTAVIRSRARATSRSGWT